MEVLHLPLRGRGKLSIAAVGSGLKKAIYRFFKVFTSSYRLDTLKDKMQITSYVGVWAALGFAGFYVNGLLHTGKPQKMDDSASAGE